MNIIIINIIVILTLLFFIYVSFQTGIVRAAFAVTAGFIAVLLAENYPYQYGINYYLIFIVSAFVVFLIGMFVAKILKFLCLSIFDKLAGAILGICLWFVVCAVFLIPVLTHGIEDVNNDFTDIFTNITKKQLPLFDEYIPNFIFDKKFKNSDKNMSLSK